MLRKRAKLTKTININKIMFHFFASYYFKDCFSF